MSKCCAAAEAVAESNIFAWFPLKKPYFIFITRQVYIFWRLEIEMSVSKSSRNKNPIDWVEHLAASRNRHQFFIAHREHAVFDVLLAGFMEIDLPVNQ